MKVQCKRDVYNKRQKAMVRSAIAHLSKSLYAEILLESSYCK